MYWTYRGAPTTLKTNPGFLSPIPEQGLEAWFDESHGIETDGDLVKKWDSRVNNHSVIQTNNTNRPTYTAKHGDLNGRGFLDFSSGTARLESSGSALGMAASGSVNYTIFSVSRLNSGATNSTLVSWGREDDATISVQLNASTTTGLMQLKMQNSTQSRTALDTNIDHRDDEFHIGTFVFGGSLINDEYVMRQDGKTYYTEVKASLSQEANINTFWVGRRVKLDTNNWAGDIAELIIYTRELPQEEIEVVEDYLFDKYFNPTKLSDLEAYFDASNLGSLDLDGV